MSENKYKPFDLEVALKQPERVITRDGRNISEIYYFKTATNEIQPVRAVIGNEIEAFETNGSYLGGNDKGSSDLFLLPETKTVWVNFYKYANGSIRSGQLEPYDDEGKAKISVDDHKYYIGTYPITIELP